MSAPLLSVQDLRVSFATEGGIVRALDGVSFDLHRGEVLGIAGLLGSGRTEILETVFGASEGRRSGTVALDGVTVEVDSPRTARRLGLALVSEDRKAKGLHLETTIRDNVTLPSVGRLARYGVRGFPAEADMARGAVGRLAIRSAVPSASKTPALQ